MPTLKTVSQKSESIQIGVNSGSNLLGGDSDELTGAGGKWEDEEERRFYEEIPDLKDYVPRSVLGIEGDGDEEKADDKEKERQEKERVEEEVRKLEEELAEMKIDGDGGVTINGKGEEVADDADELVFSRSRIGAFMVLTITQVFQRRRPGPPRSRHPILPRWRRKARLSCSLLCSPASRTRRTGRSSTRRRWTSRSSTPRRRGRGSSSS